MCIFRSINNKKDDIIIIEYNVDFVALLILLFYLRRQVRGIFGNVVYRDLFDRFNFLRTLYDGSSPVNLHQQVGLQYIAPYYAHRYGSCCRSKSAEQRLKTSAILPTSQLLQQYEHTARHGN